VVARDLEKRFEKALKALESTESEVQAHLQRLPQALCSPEEQLLKKYATDLSKLSNAPTTRAQDRKRIAGCLIENVVVTVLPEELLIKAKVHWKGGEVSVIEMPRGKSGVHRHVSEPKLV
jgi:hypothetical protein